MRRCASSWRIDAHLPEPRPVNPTKPDPGFYGDDSLLVYVTPDGRIWLVERSDEGTTLSELGEMPNGVESFHGAFSPEMEAHHLAGIMEAMDVPRRD
jgi:hypothetical protein